MKQIIKYIGLFLLCAVIAFFVPTLIETPDTRGTDIATANETDLLKSDSIIVEESQPPLDIRLETIRQYKSGKLCDLTLECVNGLEGQNIIFSIPELGAKYRNGNGVFNGITYPQSGYLTVELLNADCDPESVLLSKRLRLGDELIAEPTSNPVQESSIITTKKLTAPEVTAILNDSRRIEELQSHRIDGIVKNVKYVYDNGVDQSNSEYTPPIKDAGNIKTMLHQELKWAGLVVNRVQYNDKGEISTIYLTPQFIVED